MGGLISFGDGIQGESGKRLGIRLSKICVVVVGK